MPQLWDQYMSIFNQPTMGWLFIHSPILWGLCPLKIHYHPLHINLNVNWGHIHRPKCTSVLALKGDISFRTGNVEETTQAYLRFLNALSWHTHSSQIVHLETHRDSSYPPGGVWFHNKYEGKGNSVYFQSGWISSQWGQHQCRTHALLNGEEG